MVKTEEELEEEEARLINDKEELKKQKRRNMIKTILNPLDVPGIDLGILQRIDSLPKDQNMYTT